MGISLSHARYEEIKQIIVDMFVKYDVSCVPVNGFELATKMGVKIIPYSAIPEGKRWLLLKRLAPLAVSGRSCNLCVAIM